MMVATKEEEDIMPTSPTTTWINNLMKVTIFLMEEEAIPLEVEKEVEVKAIKVQFNVTIVQNMDTMEKIVRRSKLI